VGNPHAGFDEAGAGNGLSGTAIAFDPACGGVGVRDSPALPDSQLDLSLVEEDRSSSKPPLNM
jgi:hypothetical protein